MFFFLFHFNFHLHVFSNPSVYLLSFHQGYRKLDIPIHFLRAARSSR